MEVGTTALDFTLKSQRGEGVCLSDLKGQKMGINFFSKDNTPREYQVSLQH